MALSQTEVAYIEKIMAEFLGRIGPPAELRNKLDFIYRLEGQSIEIFEVRPQWRNPELKTEMPIAKTTFVRTKDVWKVYWRRADGKWHLYKTKAEAKTLRQSLSIIERDQYGCFFG